MEIFRKTTVIHLLICIQVFGLASHSFSADVQLPRITIEGLKNLMDNGADIVIIDTQPKKLYEMGGHIKGAVSLPWAKEIDYADVRKLPSDKPLILYCDCGPGEEASNNVGNQLMELGFKNVKILADPSIRGWKEKGYPIEK
ncbi:MAG: rhodanese-like domain-containing protein [Deltaproteobacteria bacterium]|nr:rhodanese-like domain-containing protein [Deltaproteobacteria bacterium]